MEDGVRLWLVDISSWNPSEQHFSSIVSLLPVHERSAITRFIRFEDRKRALVSRLLQYTLVHEVLGFPFDEIVISRTIEGKPYLENCGENSIFPNFNFNVSHHGDYVAIASEPLCLVGLDIVSNVIPQHETALKFIGNFASCFTASEWKHIVSASTSDAMLAEFFRYWSLKEAYVKALGAGLAYGFHRVEFRHTNWSDISVYIDGVGSKDWRFWLFKLDDNHWASVAKGHPKVAIDRHRRMLPDLDFWEEQCWNALQQPVAGFILRIVDELIPSSVLAK